MFLMNGPGAAPILDQKGYLPMFSETTEILHGITPTPLCSQVYDKESLEAFMDKHHLNNIVLKDERAFSGGWGIYRVFRDGPGKPIYMQDPKRDHLEEKEETSVFAEKSGTLSEWEPVPEDATIEKEDGTAINVSVLDEMGPVTGRWVRMPDAKGAMEITDSEWNGPMLAMERMDTSKGDIRVVVQNGSVVGAYKRMAKEGSMLCNVAQGGTVHPVNMEPGGDFSPEDMKRIHAIAKSLRTHDINTASIDMLCDFEGNWKLSEINIGNTDDIIEIQAHNRERDLASGNLLTSDAMAADMMQEYRDKVTAKETEKAAALEIMRSGTSMTL